MKHNPICNVCQGWKDIVVINGIEWDKCRICGHMSKIPKTIVTPIAKVLHEEKDR